MLRELIGSVSPNAPLEAYYLEDAGKCQFILKIHEAYLGSSEAGLTAREESKKAKLCKVK